MTTKYTGKPISVEVLRYFLSNSTVIIDTDDKLELLLETLLVRDVDVAMFRIADDMVDRAFNIINQLSNEQCLLFLTRISCWNAPNISLYKLIDILHYTDYDHSYYSYTIVKLLQHHLLHHSNNLSDDDLFIALNLYLSHKRYIDQTFNMYEVLSKHPNYERMKAKVILLNKDAMAT